MNCKLGDIAICTSGRHEGKIGTVIGPFVSGTCGGVRFDNIPATVGHVWIFEAAGVFEVGGIEYKHGPFADSMLKPVSGIPDKEEIDRRQPVTAWPAQYHTAQALMQMGVRVKPGKWPVEVV